MSKETGKESQPCGQDNMAFLSIPSLKLMHVPYLLLEVAFREGGWGWLLFRGFRGLGFHLHRGWLWLWVGGLGSRSLSLGLRVSGFCLGRDRFQQTCLQIRLAGCGS